MIVFIPTSEKELKKAEPALKFYLKTWLISFLVIMITLIIATPLALNILYGEPFLDNALGFIILGFFPVGLATFIFSTLLTIYKFRKQS